MEQIAAELGKWLKSNGCARVHAVYGCSMGGSIALMLAVGQAVQIDHCVMDGGITPYQLPWIATRFIAVRDYLMMMIGRTGGIKLLEKAFSTDEYSEDDLKYVADVLKHCSRRTLWRTFESCNNYKMPKPIPTVPAKLHYWYADKEEKERAWDIEYMKRHFAGTEFKVLEDIGHGGMAALRPQLLADMLEKL